MLRCDELDSPRPASGSDCMVTCYMEIINDEQCNHRELLQAPADDEPTEIDLEPRCQSPCALCENGWVVPNAPVLAIEPTPYAEFIEDVALNTFHMNGAWLLMGHLKHPFGKINRDDCIDILSTLDEFLAEQCRN